MKTITRNINLAMTTIVFTFSSKASAEYSANAFVIQNEDSHQIITNQDISCIRITGKDTASIKLTAEARRFFYQYTEKNLGKTLTTMLCGKPLNSAKIMSPISGEFTVGNLKNYDLTCLDTSFDTKAACHDCRVCKSNNTAFPRGFKLSQIKNGSLYQKWGLENGDTILSINDQQLNNTAQAIEILNSLKGTKQVSLKFKRDGEIKTIKIKED